MRFRATSICLNGRAYLITGKSGIGKSSLALALLEQGATLISDDVTEISDGKAHKPSQRAGWMEVRQIGLVSGFAVADAVPVAAVIELSETEPERIPEHKVMKLEEEYVPLFHLWTEDRHLTDKVFVIDGIVGGQLTQELERK